MAQVNTEQAVIVGRNSLYFEDYVLAIQYFNRAINAKPYQAQPYFYRAIAKFNLEDFAGAEADAAKAIELNPFITDAWEVRGVARQNLGKDSLAIEDYNHALSLLPRNRQLMFNKAMAQTEIKDFEGADSTYSAIINDFPNFENARLGRARLSLQRGDTLRALDDINDALMLNPKCFNAYAMRADLSIHRGKDAYKDAVADLDSAIRLKPKTAGLYINRAFLRYSLDDYFGAMNDFDHALSLEPYNEVALYNRGLLNAEVNANDRALEDFSRVLKLNPDNIQARYNRSIILANKHRFDDAITDINYVIAAYPDFPTGYFMRSDFYRRAGNAVLANADYKKASALNARLHPDAYGNVSDPLHDVKASDSEVTEKQFASLLTIEDNTDMREEYNNTAIRGKVQDRNVAVEIEPMVELSFYSSPGELRPDSYYIKEVDDLNATHALRFIVVVTVHPPVLSDEDMVQRHFRSIEDYNSYLANHSPRLVDYIGRALDQITLRNYSAAIADLDRALALDSTYAPVFMLRAQARWHILESGTLVSGDLPDDYATRHGLERKAMDDIIADIDRAIELSPRNAFLYYNKGNMMVKISDFDAAESAYNTAIELKPDFGQAFYNRGYVRMHKGQRIDGTADLSKAGELGVASAYNLLKRMSLL